MKSWADATTALEQATQVPEHSAPPLVPADQSIDQLHLARMTFGERSLEREVLQLFERQSAILLARMAGAEPKVVAAHAHTLIGSARGIGAWKVAEAGEALERLAHAETAETHADLAGALDGLASAVAEARSAIGALLRAH